RFISRRGLDTARPAGQNTSYEHTLSPARSLPMFPTIDRRGFLRGGLAAASVLAGGVPLLADEKPRLKKAVKYTMIKIKGPIEEKFELIKSLGFQGVEVDSPSDVNREEAVKARDKTGVAIHGVIDSVHWRDMLSHPDEKVRARGLAALKTALEDAKFYGAD